MANMLPLILLRKRQQKKRRAAVALLLILSRQTIKAPRQCFPRFNIDAQTDEQCLSLFRYVYHITQTSPFFRFFARADIFLLVGLLSMKFIYSSHTFVYLKWLLPKTD